MRGLLIPSLEANAPTARAIHDALSRHGTTNILHLTEANAKADVKAVETEATASSVEVIAGYSLGSHVGLRALLRRPHLSCSGIWFCPAPDAASRLGRKNIPHYLRRHMDYLRAHVEAFQPPDLIESLGRLSGNHLFVFGKNDDLRIDGEFERIQALGLDQVQAIEVSGTHFLQGDVVSRVVRDAMERWGEDDG